MENAGHRPEMPARTRRHGGGMALGVAGSRSDFSSEVFALLFDAFAYYIKSEAVHLGALFLEHLLNALLVVLDERLRQQGDFLQVLLNRAFNHLFDDFSRLAGFSSLLLGHGTLAIDVFGGYAVGAQGLGLGSSNVHGNVLAHFVVTSEVNQHADATAVDVAGQLVSRFETLETTDRHIFTDLADQSRANGFDGAVTEGGFAQGCNISRRLFSDQLCQIIHESDEVVVLGDEVGFAVDFDHCAALSVGGDMQADQAFRGDTCSCLAGLVAQLDAQNFLSTSHVAVGFRQRLLAFHHGRVGLLAQFLDHGCGNLGHNFLQFGKTRPGGAGAGSKHFSGAKTSYSRGAGNRAVQREPALFAVFLGLFDLDEFLAFSEFFDDAVDRLLTTFEYGICHTAGVQSNGLGGVIVTRDDEIDAVGGMVGINHGHNWNTQGAGFSHSNL